MKKRRINPIVFLGMLIFCVFFIINIISVQVRIGRTQAANNGIKAENEKQKNTNEQLTDILENGTNDQDYIRDTARDKLGFGEANEKVYINITGN